VTSYIDHRLAIAGGRGHLFSKAAIAQIYRYSKGIPRLINLLCDRALLGVYSENGAEVGIAMVRRAAREVMPRRAAGIYSQRFSYYLKLGFAAALAAMVLAGAYLVWQRDLSKRGLAAAEAVSNWREVMQVTAPDKSTAIGELARLWNIRADKEKIGGECPQHSDTVSCLALYHIGVTDLQRYNAPVVMVLEADTAAPRYVVLKQIREKRAQVWFDGRDWDLLWSELAQLWRGDALLLVTAPVAQLPLQPGASDALIAWFDVQLFRHFHRGERRWQREIYARSEQLADNAPKSAWLASHYLALREQPATRIYDAQLLGEVKRFQQEQALPDTGIIDLATLIALNRTSSTAPPMLSGAVEKQGG
jgi:general secretion pathway protein A